MADGGQHKEALKKLHVVPLGAGLETRGVMRRLQATTED